MQEFKKLSDQDLHLKMLDTSQRERDLTAEMVSMIEEAGRRKFYLDLGHATLFDYLTMGLSYSAGAAMRRISAARIIREMPEVKERICDGSLSLSNLSQAEQFFRNEQKHSQALNSEEKREVLQQIQNKSTRETEKTLIALSSVPMQLKTDKVKPLTSELTQITFKANAEFMSQLEEARGLLAHQMPEAALSEIMAEVMKLSVALLRKRKFKVDGNEQSVCKAMQSMECEESTGSNASAEHKGSVGSVVEPLTEPLENPSENLNKVQINTQKETAEIPARISGAGSNSRYIAASVRRAVYQRDQGRCAVVHPVTGKACGSRFKLELDHFPVPYAMGGLSIPSNLRLTCASCNKLHAVQRYGKDKIGSRNSRL